MIRSSDAHDSGIASGSPRSAKQNAIKLTPMVAGSSPRSLPRALESMQQIRGGDVPVEPYIQETLFERPQNYLEAKVDSRDQPQEKPMTRIALNSAVFNPLTHSTGGQSRVNEAESLQKSAVKLDKTSEHPDGPPCTAAPSRSLMVGESRENSSCPKEQLPVIAATLESKQTSLGFQGQSKDAVITVHYNEGEEPMSEILRLEGGQGFPVIVQALSVDSKVSRAGVGIGYALLTMNGRKEFMQLPGWQVRLLLEAPITLCFDPKPQQARHQVSMCTEIRLKRATESVGVAPRVDVFGPKDLGVLAEEVVFKPGSAPLFIRSSVNESPQRVEGRDVTNGHAKQDEGGSRPLIYELRRKDAQALVGRAAHGARAAIGSKMDVECTVALTSPGKARRPMSNILGAPPRTSPIATSSYQGTSPIDLPRANSGTLDSASAVSGIASVPELVKPRGERAYPRLSSRERCGCDPEDDDDNWLNFHSSRSPLRWLAPVLEPVVRAFSPSRSPSNVVPSKTESSPRASPRASANVGEPSASPRMYVAPVLGHALSPRGREETIARGRRDKGLSRAVREPSPNQIMQPVTGSPIASRTSGLGGLVRNVHNLSGPRSRSPQNRVPAGDTTIDICDYDEALRAGVHSAVPLRSLALPTSAPSTTAPSFRVAWDSDMLS